MPIEIKAYKCGHGCDRRILQSKSAMEKHEKSCFLNPVTRSCRTCAFDTDHFYDREQESQIVVCENFGNTQPKSNCISWKLKA